MADYIDKLENFKLVKLLDAMKIDPEENVITDGEIAGFGGKLHVVHTKNARGKFIESVYGDFWIDSIYGCEPSEYDQRRFQNVMASLLKNTSYEKDCKRFNKAREKNGK